MLGQIESILITVNLALLGVGFWMLDRGSTAVAVACFVLAGALTIGYIAYVKIRPLILAKQAFLDAAARNGMAARSSKPEKKAVAKFLRQFPGFDDFSLGIDHLHALESGSGLHIAGMYSLGGQGLNFGYFLAGVIDLSASGERLSLDKIHDRDSRFEQADERAMGRLPGEAQAAIRALPYDFSLRGDCYLVDFDARMLIAEKFGESFDQMLTVLDGLPGAEKD